MEFLDVRAFRDHKLKVHYPGFLNGFYRKNVCMSRFSKWLLQRENVCMSSRFSNEKKAPYPPLLCLQEAEAEVASSNLSCAGRQGNREAAAPSISPYMLCSYMLSQYRLQFLLLLMPIVCVRRFRIPSSSRRPIHIHLLPFCASALTVVVVDRVRTAEWCITSSSHA